MRHKDAWAEEHVAPHKFDIDPTASTVNWPPRDWPLLPMHPKKNCPHDILIVASKLKDYIRKSSGLNTSANVLDRLSDMIRLQCDKAIERAVDDGRKTVMDKDFYL